MISIAFSGWFQCRLATDPDDYNDRRGKRGWTFALPGEPDLDRVIRFQNPVAARSRCPDTGVAVRSVSVGGNIVNGHHLLNAPVELLDNPVFEGRNGEIATSAQEPIVPFKFRIRTPKVLITGGDPIDLTDINEVIRRQPVNFSGNSSIARQEAGIVNAAAWRKNRSALLQSDLSTAANPDAKRALELRIQELRVTGIQLNSLSFKLDYEFELRGPNSWQDGSSATGFVPASDAKWSVRFWMGAWDADALSAYTSGQVMVS